MNSKNIEKLTITLSDPIVTYAAGFERGDVIATHAHDRAQLVFTRDGVMTVATEKGTWVVPPQRALWLPSRAVHEIHFSSDGFMRTLYFERRACLGAPVECTVVEVSPLLRELIIASVEGGRAPARWSHTIPLILAEIAAASVAPLNLPQPDDPRLAHVTQALQIDPGSQRTLTDWARDAGTSARTLARLFVAQTGMSFRQWQRQVRLLAALVRLAERQPVTTIASDLGYESPSAFIYAFRKALGTTPKRYFQATAS